MVRAITQRGRQEEPLTRQAGIVAAIGALRLNVDVVGSASVEPFERDTLAELAKDGVLNEAESGTPSRRNSRVHGAMRTEHAAVAFTHVRPNAPRSCNGIDRVVDGGQ